MQILREEGFRRARPYQATEPQIRTLRQHRYEYFPQWRFFEDAHNEYLLTDFAHNGSLMLYAKRQIDSYCMEIVHLVSTHTNATLVGFPVVTAATKLWREEALFIFAGIVEAVVYMHSKGVCHLDLDVHNVVIDSLGCPMIVGFGRGEVADEDGLVGRSRPILCKRPYAAPEVYAHNRNVKPSSGVDGRAADMYSLGVILYWLLFMCPSEGAIIDPVRSDPRWLLNLIHHASGNFDSHEDLNCAICQSSIPLDAEIIQLLLALLSKNPADRVSAADLSTITRTLYNQLHGDTSTRNQAVLEELHNCA
ncbi:hypothetical protein Poli38472_008701 [Pythium oligandrum]|uniref:Protein kinase domain-containing protein n=1 Tax=Pythium oligandrum TaxID=41045 RepID=A0A8K1FEP5_PYTOL|nr:hypothetical protein Poli38472_008701 [Pythium oligandrum]|eukprot:TMW56053.1 hypothetical protein Poli38472_008701 [Pythium oligandrum]